MRTTNSTNSKTNPTTGVRPIAEIKDALASTIHISTNNQPQPPRPTPDRTQRPRYEDQGVIGPEETPPSARLSLQIPNRVPTAPTSRTRNRSTPTRRSAVQGTRPLPARTCQCLRHLSPYHHTRAVRVLDRLHGQVLLRKEVIQPHLPVRLPCYDFVPIASPTFDRSLPLRG
jgi:hypothetical protein